MVMYSTLWPSSTAEPSEASLAIPTRRGPDSGRGKREVMGTCFRLLFVYRIKRMEGESQAREDSGNSRDRDIGKSELEFALGYCVRERRDRPVFWDGRNYSAHAVRRGRLYVTGNPGRR